MDQHAVLQPIKLRRRERSRTDAAVLDPVIVFDIVGAHAQRTNPRGIAMIVSRETIGSGLDDSCDALTLEVAELHLLRNVEVILRRASGGSHPIEDIAVFDVRAGS